MINEGQYRKVFTEHDVSNWFNITFFGGWVKPVTTQPNWPAERNALNDFLNLYHQCQEDCSHKDDVTDSDIFEVIVGEHAGGVVGLTMFNDASWSLDVFDSKYLADFRKDGVRASCILANVNGQVKTATDLEFLNTTLEGILASCENFANKSSSESKGYEPEEVKEDIMDITRQMCGR